MKRASWKLLALTLVVCLALTVPVQAFAAEKSLYVSLGDSIAAGFSADPGRNYFDLYASHLGTGYDSVNLGWPGKTSSQMLAELRDPNSPAAQALALPQVRVVTLSIGPNNLLGPILATVYAQCGIDPTNKPPQQAQAELVAFINANPQAWQAVVAATIASAQPGGPLYAALQNGARQFVTDFPQIMRAINSLAPRARVYVLTTYNPLRGDPSVGSALDNLVLPMNAAVRLAPLKYRNVRVIPNYLLFALHKGALSFDLTKVPADMASVDPHPTTYGHYLIYRDIVLKDLMFPR